MENKDNNKENEGKKRVFYISLISLLAVIIIIIILLLSLKGCNKDDNKNPNNKDNSSDTSHTHEYANEFSSDAFNHWYADTCGHNTKKDVAAHTWNDGVETADGTKFTCTVCGYAKTETSKFRVSETKWKEILNNTVNYTVDETITLPADSLKMIIYVSENSVLGDHVNDYKELAIKENDKYYGYSFTYGEDEWIKEEITEDVYNDSNPVIFSPILDEYSKFTYNLETKKYTLDSLDITDLASVNTILTNISIGFEDEKVSSFEFTMSDSSYSSTAQIACKDFGSTTITVPTNVHSHTYASTWSYNEDSHWYADTCGHNTKKDVASHSYGDWVVVTEATETTIGSKKRVCSVCGSEDTEEIAVLPHTHTYATEWSSDDTKHWLASTCGHDVTSSEANHTFYQGRCSVCGYEGIIYTLSDDYSHYIVTGLKSEISGEIVIPSTYKGLPVTEIGDMAFKENSSITSVTIPDSITSIGDYAFFRCPNIATINMGNGVTSIGGAAFQRCSSLTSITIPASVTNLGNTIFYECTSLKSATILADVSTIKMSQFNYCSSLEWIILSTSITLIEYQTFMYCTSLTSVYYLGTPEQLTNLIIQADVPTLVNKEIYQATKYCYSEDTPTDTTNNYWHYVDGVSTPYTLG